MGACCSIRDVFPFAAGPLAAFEALAEALRERPPELKRVAALIAAVPVLREGEVPPYAAPELRKLFSRVWKRLLAAGSASLFDQFVTRFANVLPPTRRGAQRGAQRDSQRHPAPPPRLYDATIVTILVANGCTRVVDWALFTGQLTPEAEARLEAIVDRTRAGGGMKAVALALLSPARCGGCGYVKTDATRSLCEVCAECRMPGCRNPRPSVGPEPCHACRHTAELRVRRGLAATVE